MNSSSLIPSSHTTTHCPLLSLVCCYLITKKKRNILCNLQTTSDSRWFAVEPSESAPLRCCFRISTTLLFLARPGFISVSVKMKWVCAFSPAFVLKLLDLLSSWPSHAHTSDKLASGFLHHAFSLSLFSYFFQLGIPPCPGVISFAENQSGSGIVSFKMVYSQWCNGAVFGELCGAFGEEAVFVGGYPATRQVLGTNMGTNCMSYVVM